VDLLWSEDDERFRAELRAWMAEDETSAG